MTLEAKTWLYWWATVEASVVTHNECPCRAGKEKEEWKGAKNQPTNKHKNFKCSASLIISLVQFSRTVVSDSLWLHEPQHTRPPCPSPTPRVHPNPCPLSWWCHPTISSSVIPFSSCPQSFPALGFFFSNESALRIRWPKYWSFSFNISVSNEHPGLISFRMDWLDLLAVQGTLKSLLQYYSLKAWFFGTQAFLWSNSHICMWLLEKP